MKKGIIAALTCALFAVAVPMTAKAWTGDPIRGYDTQEQAAMLDFGNTYYEEHIIEGRDYYYKFNTSDKDGGVYLVSLESIVIDNSASGTFTAQVKDRYGSVIDQATVGGAGATYRNDGGRALDILFPLSGLPKNEPYFICLKADDGSNAQLEITNRLGVRYIPFFAAEGFTMKNANGNLNFSWNNVQRANTYNSLSSFDAFQIELYGNNTTKIKEAGNGGTTSYSLSVTDPDLLALGYPAKSVRVRLGCIQRYRSVLEHTVTTSKVIYSNTVINTEVVKKKTPTAISSYKYEITKVAGDGSGTVKLLGFGQKKNVKKVKIPASVNINGTYYRVTEIDTKAFAGNKTITTLEVGENVNKIGANAFNGCSSLKKITFKAGNVTSIGKTAFSGINKKTTIYTPTTKIRKKYKKLLKKKIVAGVKYKIS
ncbi:leucine-rich repeat protein [Butyrivibrio sp. VCD2006]|uniref:leucine-rich repeat protein n=1 Tax=Butyrivibrio sp. VCD2006 TaxID=1280664 RepID=UPI000423ACD6|nr:leucine-rich repeat protein [Butyrivibrio sp. VCD2006]